MSIGGLEILAYILVLAATAGIGVYQYNGWWQWKASKRMNLRDIRLSSSEISCLAGGIILLIAAAFRETAMANDLTAVVVRFIQGIA